jgi:hypothetical protein
MTIPARLIAVTIRDESENEKSIDNTKRRANTNRARRGGDRILPTPTVMNGDAENHRTRNDERSIPDMMMCEYSSFSDLCFLASIPFLHHGFMKTNIA